MSQSPRKGPSREGRPGGLRDNGDAVTHRRPPGMIDAASDIVLDMDREEAWREPLSRARCPSCGEQGSLILYGLVTPEDLAESVRGGRLTGEHPVRECGPCGVRFGRLDDAHPELFADEQHASEPRPPCPACGSVDVLPFLYGEPDPGVRGSLFGPGPDDDVALGGCQVHDDAPAWKCRACRLEFGRFADRVRVEQDDA